jgi:H+/Cl- antiporter ClcA
LSQSHPYINTLNQIIKWFLLCLIIGVIIGSATAYFLISLDYVTKFRENNIWILFGLPIAGILIGYSYSHTTEINKGNNLLIEAHHKTNKQKSIPFLMAPMVFTATLLTHLVGGSAGREGTAVQMGGAIADQFTNWFTLSNEQRKTLLIMGISAGFAAVFGTPLAGAIFALEIMGFKQIRFQSIIPSFIVAFIAHYTCLQWNVQHTQYEVHAIPVMELKNIGWACTAGLLFGFTAMVFSYSNSFWKFLFNKINKPLLVSFMGGLILLLVFKFTPSNSFMGLGIPEIVNAFEKPSGQYDFLIKLLLTSFTLSVGFKGGEVTPLFFIGATLGSALMVVIPLPLSILAAMGFVAVFAGATHCVIASIVMGFEIFGIHAGLFIGVACIAAYFSSGKKGIYSAQLGSGVKYTLYNYFSKVKEL